MVIAAGPFQFGFALVEGVFELVDAIFLAAELAFEQLLVVFVALAAGQAKPANRQ